jgi:hypothetical protein
MIDKKDNPALKRATITSMLSDGAVLTAAGMGRAGYGFDVLVKQGKWPPASHGSGRPRSPGNSCLNSTTWFS